MGSAQLEYKMYRVGESQEAHIIILMLQPPTHRNLANFQSFHKEYSSCSAEIIPWLTFLVMSFYKFSARQQTQSCDEDRKQNQIKHGTADNVLLIDIVDIVYNVF